MNFFTKKLKIREVGSYCRRIVYLSAFLILSFVFTAVSWGQTPVGANGKLSISGTSLVNQYGDPVQLRGMSSHGVNWFNEDYNFYSLRVLAQDWDIDIFRIAMYPTEQPDQTNGGYEGNPEFWKNYIDDLVDLCGMYGVYCIIDWHVLTPGDPNDPNYLPMAKDFWNYMSAKHGSKDHVLYEICNEPNGVDWATVKSYAEQIIPIIRANDPDNIILIGSPTWSSDVDIASQNPVTGYDNLAYSFHFYAGSHGDNYRTKITTALTNGLCVFVTEWGTTAASGGGGIYEAESQVWLDFMQTNNLSWTNWSYSDKDEGSATLLVGSGAAQSWNNLSASGVFVKNAIQSPGDSWASDGNHPPVANISSPLKNAYALPGETFNITADAFDDGGTVSSVSFYVDGNLLSTDNSAPYTAIWTPSSVNDYILTAVATDNDGATGTSLQIPVHIVSEISQSAYPDGIPHGIPGTITAWQFDNGGEMIAYHDLDGVHKGPVSGNERASEGVDVEGSSNIGYVLTGEWLEYTVNIAASGTYDFELDYASAIVNGGAFHFEINGEAVSDVTQAPGTGNWGSYQTATGTATLPAGEQVIRIFIDQGNINFREIRFVSNTEPPSVALTAPSSGTSVVVGTAIDMAATASDSDGTISKVEFYVGPTLVATDNTAPYTGSWIAQLDGNYSITAVAYDNMNATATSGVASITVTSDLTEPTTSNLALNQPATASSLENASFPASNAVDGSTGTRWASEFNQPEWIYVDLGSDVAIERVILNWEAAYATSYEIQVSSDASSWTTVALIAAANGSIDDIVFPAVTARYVRMYGIQRVTEYGFSIYEFEVYGPEGTTEPVTGVSVDPVSVTLLPGEIATLVETVEPANATNKNISWSTSNAAVATVSSGGLVSAIGEGTATITVTTEDGGFTASCDITVEPEPVIDVTGVELDITASTIFLDTCLQLTTTIFPENATNKSVVWSSSDISIATVDQNGLVCAVNQGNVTITATTVDGGFTAQCEITIEEPPIEQYTLTVTVIGGSSGAIVIDPDLGLYDKGTSVILTALQPDNGTEFVGWSGDVNSTDLQISVIMDDNKQITATYEPVGECPSISMPFEQNGAGNLCFTASGTVNYINSWNMDYVEVNGQDFTNVYASGGDIPTSADGLIHIIYEASVSWAHFEINGIDETQQSIPVIGVTVSPTSDSIETGGTINLSATVSPSDATDKSVSWSSDNPSVATVNSSGVVTAVAEGAATITVTTTDGGFTASMEIKVTEIPVIVPVTGVTVSPASDSVEVGETLALSATVSPSDATDKSVNWSSNNPSVATVNSGGVVTGVADGTATITVTTTDGGFTAVAEIIVSTRTVPLCENPETISLTFLHEGAGEYCWFTSDDIAYVNSWTTNSININGVDFTNTWSNNLPPKIDGGYYISFSGSFGWSHLEVAGLKSAENIGVNTRINVFPNPFNESTRLVIDNPEIINSIQVFDQVGKLIVSYYAADIHSFMEIGQGFESGIYLVRVISESNEQIIMINKQ